MLKASYKLLQGHILDRLRQLPDNSVHCIVTSPPYWGLRDYGVPGQLGVEPTPKRYLAKMVEVFREVRRVLRHDGTLWCNMGDSYANTGTGGNGATGGLDKSTLRSPGPPPGTTPVKKHIPAGLKAKDLVGMPWRLAFALQDDGWYLRQDIIWCLSGGAWVYARTQKGDMPIMLKDLVRLPTTSVKLWNGMKWTRVKSWTRNHSPEEKIELVLRSGERIGCTETHYWPTQRGNVRTSELRLGDVLQTCQLPESNSLSPNYLTHDAMWLIGIYLAEGSRADDTIQLALHADEMGWLPRIEAIAQHYGGSVTHTLDGDNLSVRMYGRVLVAMIDSYIGGTDAQSKHLKVAAWMLSNTALRSLVDGYLAGDSHSDTQNKRYRLGFTRNYSLERDLRVLAARLGATLTLRPSMVDGFGKKWPAFRGEWRWERSGHHNEKPRSELIAIRRSRGRKFWDIEVEDDPHLFALASGVLTHNSKPNPMPESVTDRCTKAHEYLFLLTKSRRYFYDAEAIKEPANGWNGSEFHDGKNLAVHPNVGKNRAHARGKGVNPKATQSLPGTKQNESFSAAVSGLVEKRNKRSVWEIATESFAEAHFATFPTKLVEPCILAGTSTKGVCANCGAPWRRIVETERSQQSGSGKAGNVPTGKRAGGSQVRDEHDIRMGPSTATVTVGWKASCKCDAELVAATVLDPFNGSGTTGLVALANRCNYIGIDLNPEYLEMAERRLSAATAQGLLI